jgi:hypothetical protein
MSQVERCRLSDENRPIVVQSYGNLMRNLPVVPQRELVLIGPKKTDLAPKTINDQKAINDRMRECSVTYPAMQRALDQAFSQNQINPTASELRQFADFLVEKEGRSKLDRLARRNKQATICWFCEQCPELLVTNSLFIRYAATLTRTPKPPLPSIQSVLSRVDVPSMVI